ncbi:MAG: DUF4388 domain-containing protein [Myxococcaceae bacterium]
MGTLPRATVAAAGEALAVELPRQARLTAGAGYDFASHGPDGLVLLREGAAPGGYFAGDLICLGMAEVFGHLVSGIRSGQLVVSRGPLRKTVSLRDGQVIFATSSEPHERLGRALVRRKVVTPGQLDAALDKVRPGLKLGQVLTRSRVVSASGLYAAMTDLVQEIVLGLFELTQGHFLFLEGGPLPEDSVKLPARTRDLVLEGLRRGEEVLRLRRRLPPSLRLVAGAAPSTEEPLVTLAGQGAELSVLMAGFEGGEHAFLTGVARLLEAGALLAEAAAPAPAPRAPSPLAAEPPSTLSRYASLIHAICHALASAGKDLSDLRSFFSDPLPGLEQAFKGVALADDGSLDVEAVRGNITAPDEAVARALAYEALDAFVSYALFSAKNVLPPEQARALGAQFKRLQEGTGA